MNPTSRALLALELISDRPGITAERLGERLGVSERAARRYVETLREAEIPVESVRGRYGGYRIGRGLRLPPLTFGAEEALALVMAVLDGHHQADDPTDLVGSALGRIIRALPEPVAAQAEAVRRAARPAPDRSAARPDRGITTTLVRARAEEVRVHLEYRTEAGSELSLEADPWAVVVRHGRWYLLCYAHSRQAPRVYRIDRIRRAEMLAEPFTPPPGLDPVAELERHLGVGWEFDTDVLVRAPAAEVSSYLPRALGELVAVDAASCRLRGSTGNPVWYAEQLARLPVPFEVSGGPELREAVRTLADRLAAAAS